MKSGIIHFALFFFTLLIFQSHALSLRSNARHFALNHKGQDEAQEECLTRNEIDDVIEEVLQSDPVEAAVDAVGEIAVGQVIEAIVETIEEGVSEEVTEVIEATTEGATTEEALEAGESIASEEVVEASPEEVIEDVTESEEPVEEVYEDIGGDWESDVEVDGEATEPEAVEEVVEAIITEDEASDEETSLIASFTSSKGASNLIIDFDATTNSDGTIVDYAWDFGDPQSASNTATGLNPSHTYTEPGAYVVTLTVTDDQGAATTTTKNVVVRNTPPTAQFTTSVGANNRIINFDASTSTDSDGTITSYAWNFGDGKTATGQKVSHTYAKAGTYSVTLTVTDNLGAKGTLKKNVVVKNNPPIARFTISAGTNSRIFDASTSTDSDGTITSYAWNFGDGTTATGKKVSHAFAKEGTYTVTLTVTDNLGAKATAKQSITKKKVVVKK